MMAALRIGFALTGSFCTFARVIQEVQKLTDAGHEVTPILSFAARDTDTRFGKAEDFSRQLEEITGQDAHNHAYRSGAHWS